VLWTAVSATEPPYAYHDLRRRPVAPFREALVRPGWRVHARDAPRRRCVDVCPVDCIHDGACEPECPVEAIFPEDALPEKWQPFVKINYAYPDADPINSLVDEYAREHNVQNPPLGAR